MKLSLQCDERLPNSADLLQNGLQALLCGQRMIEFAPKLICQAPQHTPPAGMITLRYRTGNETAKRRSSFARTAASSQNQE